MNETTFYTGKGDHGDTTRLGGEGRLPKNSALIDVIGDIDEATSAIGMARSLAQDSLLQEGLPTIQRHISQLMAHLSATPAARERFSGLSEGEVRWLEELIARLASGIPPLRDFVLPGDSTSGAACHIARTIVRRAERRLVAFAELEPDIGPPNLAYMNRLSALMFVAALREDRLAGKNVRLARESSDVIRET
jgi:cob(I)alamin adenosyltransferase